MPSPIVRLALANAIGFSASNAVAYWITSVGARFGLPVWSGALIATTQLMILALFNLATPWLFSRWPRRTVALTACAIGIVGNGIALLPSLGCVLLGCALYGAALGVLLNTTYRMATQTPSVEKSFATFQITGALFAMSFLLIVPWLARDVGTYMVFVVLALLSATAMAMFASVDFEDFTSPVAVAVEAGGPVGAMGPRIMGLLALFLLYVGESTLNAFLVPLGALLSIDIATVGRIMAIGLVTSLIGGVGARLLGDRIGTIAPIVGSALLLAIDVVVTTSTRSAAIFTMGAIVYCISIVFVGPFASALLARVDASGRTASIAPAFLMVGLSAGPSVAAFAAVTIGMQAIGWVACASILIATLLFVAAGTRVRA